jgi:hypothetical protein
MAYTAALFQGRQIINQDSHAINTLNQLNYHRFLPFFSAFTQVQYVDDSASTPKHIALKAAIRGGSIFISDGFEKMAKHENQENCLKNLANRINVDEASQN